MSLERNFRKFFELINEMYFSNLYLYVKIYTIIVFKLIRVEEDVSNGNKRIRRVRVKKRRG